LNVSSTISGLFPSANFSKQDDENSGSKKAGHFVTSLTNYRLQKGILTGYIEVITGLWQASYIKFSVRNNLMKLFSDLVFLSAYRVPRH
jgi:hypothetical protein